MSTDSSPATTYAYLLSCGDDVLHQVVVLGWEVREVLQEGIDMIIFDGEEPIDAERT